MKISKQADGEWAPKAGIWHCGRHRFQKAEAKLGAHC
jgi:hypothetical protein